MLALDRLRHLDPAWRPPWDRQWAGPIWEAQGWEYCGATGVWTHGLSGPGGVLLDVSSGVVEAHRPAAADLVRVYCRLAELDGWCVELVAGGLEAGRATLIIDGPDVRLGLQNESGEHVWVRGSDRTTVQVAVLPTADDYPLAPADVGWCSRPKRGGQQVANDPTVHCRHWPSGLEVVCRTWRSVVKNRALALRVLKARVAALEASPSAPTKQVISAVDHASGTVTINTEPDLEGETAPEGEP